MLNWKSVTVGYCVIFIVLIILILLIWMLVSWIDNNNDQKRNVKGDVVELKVKPDEETPKTVKQSTEQEIQVIRAQYLHDQL